MQDHIFTVVGRYKGRVGSWDVVNEALDDNGELRKTRWYNIVGEEYIARAFEYAHQADPNAELYYNDFDMWKPGKVQGTIKLVKDLRAGGLRIDGIGMQGHWGMNYPTLEELESAIRALSALGVKLMITELDLTILPSPFDETGADIDLRAGLTEENNPYVDGLPDDARQRLDRRYADLFGILHKHRDSFSRVTFWGVHDGHSWRNYWPIRGRTDYPLLFDRQYQPKSAFDAVIKVVEKSR
jgi:endo-1,4-beta-xylanase